MTLAPPSTSRPWHLATRARPRRPASPLRANPADGTKEFYGDFLVNAQGEDVVAGIRNTEPIADLKTTPGLESAGEELERVFLDA